MHLSRQLWINTGLYAFNTLFDLLSKTTGSNSTALFSLLELTKEISVELLFDFHFRSARKNWRPERVVVHVWAPRAPAFHIWNTVVWNNGTSPKLEKGKTQARKQMETGKQKIQGREKSHGNKLSLRVQETFQQLFHTFCQTLEPPNSSDNNLPATRK